MVSQYVTEPIAIVGSACRFPGGSTSPSKLWSLLEKPRDVLRTFSPQHLNLDKFYCQDGNSHGSTNVINKSYLLEKDTRLFDAAFFNISPLEAQGMDPQQRVLLETVFEAFESSGFTLEQMQGSLTSVHVGVMNADYYDLQLRDSETIPKYNATGTARSIISNRISYVFDLRGPSMTIDTACSSSLVALHQAIQSLRQGDCTAAVVGGVNLIFDPSMYITESKLHMLSAESRSRMWDKDANGYARGEGVTAIILKPLSKALRDGDHVEGIVRGTGVNSDGQSQGITMPSATAQAALIRHTYIQAGLDPVRNRCQFFECHGTGTPAGDPMEASAISQAMFDDSQSEPSPSSLYVGSIKTIIGHTEGCAGLAGVMKVLLALKNRTIPPNLLFNELNPAIAPFYNRLQIPISALPWPEPVPGSPRRASVNSFGFGGTNAHAIIEEYVPNPHPYGHDSSSDRTFYGPLTISARSDQSLLGNVQTLFDHLTAFPSTNLNDVAWTMQKRRTNHRVKTAFVGKDRRKLLAAMEQFLHKNSKSPKASVGTRAQPIDANEIAGVLGIFTGQGAQWPAMGRELYHVSPLFRQSITICEDILKALKDAPDWSLTEELLADASSSRLSEAALSQPLCTAVQIALVDLLTAAGLHLDAVVGHSSGEIAATYACGIVNRTGAMQIAYYRGFYANLAKGIKGQAGGMTAVGISYEKASEFCSTPTFKGRLTVAASNGPQSVTLSGDLDAISEVKQHFDEQNIFNRQLKVDTAYHSHHMIPCVEPYLQSLLSCNIEVRKPRDDCVWSSSVRGDAQLLKRSLDSLKGPYWVQNMQNTVLFSQAVESSIWHGGPFELTVEVGPHAALKGPTEQTLKAVFGSAPPYTSLLRRGEDDIEAFSAALGMAWSYLGPSFVDFDGYRQAVSTQGSVLPSMVKDLPPYVWEHDKVYWRESRISRKFRLGSDKFHELLGRRTPDDTEHEMRWRNVLKLSEIPWLRGHEVLGEILLPGAAYISLALQAGQQLAAGKSIKLLEVLNVDIRRPVVIPDSKDGVETLFTTRLHSDNSKDTLKADFAYYYCADEAQGSTLQTCSGQLLVHLGAASVDELPKSDALESNLLTVDSESIYSAFDQLGLCYTESFKRLRDVQRAFGRSTATATWSPTELSLDYTVHPALLDVVFQSLFIARSHPGSGQLSNALLPVHIRRVVVNPNTLITTVNDETKVSLSSYVTDKTTSNLAGDLHIYNNDQGTAFLQVEGLLLQGVSHTDSSQDRQMMAETLWKRDVTFGFGDVERLAEEDVQETTLAEAADRAAAYYMRKAVKIIREADKSSLAWQFQYMLDGFERLLGTIEQDQHPLVKKEWLFDEFEVLQTLTHDYPGSIDLQLIHAIGQNLEGVLSGETQLLQVMLQDDMLNRFYMEGCGFHVINSSIRTVLQQITHKFPRTNILEIGAGTGATTWSILNAIDNAYETYTYTDISTGFFEKAADKFADFSRKIIFKPLDIEKAIDDQGFVKHSYDVVVAANVLHATRSLGNTMEHVRSLLKPGGFLVLLEVTNPEILRLNFIMGGLPGWWLGQGDGRQYYPGITVVEWDDLLLQTGFSGVESAFHDLSDQDKHCNSLVVSQAVDDVYLQLRDPLANTSLIPHDTPLLIIGTKSLSTTKISNEIQRLLPNDWKHRSKVYRDIDAVDVSRLVPGTDVVSLQELDASFFSGTLTDKRLNTIQSLLLSCKTVLWVTKNRRSCNPQSNMFLGIARALFQELPQLNMQFLDLEFEDQPVRIARVIFEAFTRLKVATSYEVNSHHYLWAQEMEMVVDGSQTLIPRVLPNTRLNERYNANNRIVTKSVKSSEVGLRAMAGADGVSLVAYEPPSELSTRFNTSFSLSIPGEIDNGLYLCCGRKEESNEFALLLSSINASVLELDSDETLSIDPSELSSTFLSIALEHLYAETLSVVTSSEDTILVYEPKESLAAIILRHATLSKRNILFLSSSSTSAQGWIQLHKRLSTRAVKKALPRKQSYFIDCSGSADSSLLSCLSSQCQTFRLDAPFLRSALKTTSSRDLLVRSLLPSRYQAQQVRHEYPLVRSHELPSVEPQFASCPYIVDWTDTADATVTVKPLNYQGLFKPSKTYLMVGMAGGLGLSICQWAVRNGARHLVITSRNPQIDSQWLEEARQEGADIQLHAMDVTDKNAVNAVVAHIKETMPPLAGVCNAAMVLSDKLFVDMDAETFNKTLKPKVDGTKNLNEAVSGCSLDYFILLSSSAAIVGNPGQSNYHAANLFMTGLAAQRRRQGLPASVIHIGLVTDVGYVTRQDKSIEERLRSMLFLPLSETDVHHAFAEAIEMGQPSATNSFEIIMGIEPISKPMDIGARPAWLANPRFSHLLPPTSLQQGQNRSSIQHGDVLQRLNDSETEEEAVVVVQEAFCVKLETMMQLPSGSVKSHESMIDYGIDSLVAVEVRNWFMKTLGTEVPVMKILGGDTIAQICTVATKKVLASKMRVDSIADQVPPPNPSSSMDDSSDSDSNSGDSAKSSVCETGASSATSEAGDMSDMTTRETERETEAEAEINFVREGVMSPAQCRLWFLAKHLKDPAAYNMTFSYVLNGALSIPRLRHALNTTVQHHEVLRTCFFARLADSQPMQGVLRSGEYSFRHVENATEDNIAQELKSYGNRVWNLEKQQLFGVSVLSKNAKEHTIIFGYHHIIMDALSWHLFLRDLNISYQLRDLKHRSGTYLDFSVKQVEAIKSGAYEQQLKYWQSEFATLPAILPLFPMAEARTRPVLQTFETAYDYRELSASQITSLKSICRALRITPSHFHLAVLQVLLARYLNVDDLCIGVADANRTDEDYATTIGFFMNLLPVRFHLAKQSTFSEIAQHTAKRVFSALSNSAVPFDAILDSVNAQRSSAFTPLFQAVMNYRMGAVWEVPLGDSNMKLSHVEDAKNPYDISLGILETNENSCIVEMTTQATLYGKDACTTILETYMHLFDCFVQNSDRYIDDCPLNNQDAVMQAVAVGRGPKVDFGWPASLSERFRAISQTYASHPAIKIRDQVLNYSGLADRVNSIVTLLLSRGCNSRSHIAVLCEPSVDSVASMLAVMHVGAIYVPLDLSLPSIRHKAMVEDCDAALVLCHSKTKKEALELECPALQVDNEQQRHSSVEYMGDAKLPAILLYTSGSTGRPKGILLSQANFVNHLALKTRALSLTQETVLQQSSSGFDMSLIQTFCALANGGTLVIVPQEARRDPVEITQTIFRERVTFTIATPSEYVMWIQCGSDSLRQNSSWRHACMGGEIVRTQLKREFQTLELPNLSLTNCYGPTETTAAATFQTVSFKDQDESSVGKALPNYNIYIVDSQGNPLPVKHRGEICIGGAGVATGYLNLPEKTLGKFVPEINHQERHMYRTGDQGYLQPDGTLVLLGRMDGDTQIKLRGLRIELEEIEGAILEQSKGNLSNVIVALQHGVLIAYAVASDIQTIPDSMLRYILKTLPLPQYMCPSQIVMVDALPCNSNGKIDRKAIANFIPNTAEHLGQSTTQGKLTIHEGELRILWDNVLPSPCHLSSTSDFFERGGNSLLLMKLQGQIRASMGVSISTVDLYQASTLRQMAARIRSKREQQTADDEKIDWIAETQISSNMMTAVQTRQPNKAKKQGNIEVLVTGATSFLGNAIVQSLLKNSAISRIHCIAIQPDEERRISQSNRLKCYTGSLLSSTLGLSKADREFLQSCVDVIIHAGSNGHCLNNYSSLRTPNVQSTRFLASLALARSIPMVYISSNRVALLSGRSDPLPVSVSSFQPRTDGAEGFTASKWASETLLQNVTDRELGIRVQVHRPCVVVGDQAPNSDALNALLRYAILMRCVPRLETAQGYFDFKSADVVAKDIADSAAELAVAEFGPRLEFRHHSGGVKVGVQSFREYMERLHDVPFEEENITTWLDRASKAGMDPLISSYLEGIVERGETITFPYMGEKV